MLGGSGAGLLIPTLRRHRQVDLCEFEASLVYKASSRIGSKATETPCHDKTKTKQKQTKTKQQQNPKKANIINTEVIWKYSFIVFLKKNFGAGCGVQPYK